MQNGQEPLYSANSSAAARRPALIINSSGIVSIVFLPINNVLHSESPQTLQHRLWPTAAPSHSSSGLPLIQIRFDWTGSFLNAVKSIVSDSKLACMPSSARAFWSFLNAVSMVSPVSLQRLQVWPASFTSLLHRIVNVFIVIFDFLCCMRICDKF